jgi:hypothetical protein
MSNDQQRKEVFGLSLLRSSIVNPANPKQLAPTLKTSVNLRGFITEVWQTCILDLGPIYRSGLIKAAYGIGGLREKSKSRPKI